MNEIKIQDLSLGRCYIIAEVGLNHNGCIETAKKLIDVAAIAGVDAVKFQKRTVESLAISEVLDAEDNRFPDFGGTYRQIRESLEFGFDEYCALKKYSEDRGLDFIVTAFDLDAVDFLERVGVTHYKLASHSLTNLNLLSYLAEKKYSTILSTGMADWDEIDAAVEIFQSRSSELSLLHCVSAYPTPIEECNIGMVSLLRSKYGVRTGYSGHELGYLPTLLAVSLGAEIVERHITLNKNLVGFDHKISLEPDELISMVRDIRMIRLAMGSGKKEITDTEWITRKKYHVSMVSKVEIKKGQMLTSELVVYKNPGTGIPAKSAHLILGKIANRDIPKDVLFSEEMFC